MESHAHPEPDQPAPTDQQDVPGPSSGASDTAPSPVLRVGYETGMMPGKWLRRWRERGDGLDEQQLAPGQWPQALGETVDVALIRLEGDGQVAHAEQCGIVGTPFSSGVLLGEYDSHASLL